MRSFAEDGARDIERAAGLYNEALRFFTRDKYPRESAAVHNNLGAALSALCRMTGEPGYARQAVESLSESLSSEIFKNSPSDKALSYSNLGSAYASLASGPRENYLKAAESLGLALGFYKSCGLEGDMAETCGALGDVYARLAEDGGETPYYTQAIGSYEEALRIYTIDDFPGEYADIMKRLGDAHVSLAEMQGVPHDYEEALRAYGESLGVYTREGAAAESDALNVRIGRVYKALGDREAGSNNPDKAIEYYDEALLYYPEETARGEHAASGRKLGEAFERLYRESGDETLIRKAIAAYSEALYARGRRDPGSPDIARALGRCYTGLRIIWKGRAITRSGRAAECFSASASLDCPTEYAEPRGGWAVSLAGMPNEHERALNVELAIDSYKEALGFYGEGSHPDVREELSGIVGGLLKELAGYESGDLNKRIGLYQEALGYYSAGLFPYEHALILRGLGGAHSELGFAEEPFENSCKAADFYNKALDYLSKPEHRREFASTQYDLGALYLRLYEISGDGRSSAARSPPSRRRSRVIRPKNRRPNTGGVRELERVRGLISDMKWPKPRAPRPGTAGRKTRNRKRGPSSSSSGGRI
jgi:tetratricopeptide (TPR) repeat protein